MALSAFSNAELANHLRSKLSDRSWKPIEFVEAERRGDDCLDSDPELAEAFWAERDRMVAPAVEAFRAAYEPTRLALERLAGKVAMPALPEPERLLDLPEWSGNHDAQILVVLERSDSRQANIDANTGRDWVFWVQFAGVLLGVVIAAAALFLS
jgi:hypothetical protein